VLWAWLPRGVIHFVAQMAVRDLHAMRPAAAQEGVTRGVLCLERCTVCCARCAVPRAVCCAGRCAAGRPVCFAGAEGGAAEERGRPASVLPAGWCAAGRPVCCAGWCAASWSVCCAGAEGGGAAEERGRPAGVLPASQMVCCWPAGVLAK
jgi:hypothetical protein